MKLQLNVNCVLNQLNMHVEYAIHKSAIFYVRFRILIHKYGYSRCVGNTFECPKCNKYFDTSDLLQNHIGDSHAQDSSVSMVSEAPLFGCMSHVLNVNSNLKTKVT